MGFPTNGGRAGGALRPKDFGDPLKSLRFYGMLLVQNMRNEHFKKFRSTCALATNCAVVAAHARLNDAHRLWHKAAASYSDPEDFMTCMNACIQSLRNVTFALQSGKAAMPGFDEWYAGWQRKMKADPFLKWLHDARTRIVHQGDLKTHSVAVAQLIDGYLVPQSHEFTVDPLMPTAKIAAQLLATIPPGLRKHSYLRVERRWIADDLPSCELLDALATAHGTLSMLVNEAHGLLVLPNSGEAGQILPGSVLPQACPAQMAGPLPCMISTHETRSLCIQLDSGERLRISRTPFTPQVSSELVRERYGTPAGIAPSKCDAKHLRELVQFFFARATQMFLVDGYLIPTVFLVLPHGSVQMLILGPQDRTAKYFMWRSVADTVEQTRADAVFVIAESWMAPYDSQTPDRFPSDSPQRIEVVGADGISRYGEQVAFHSQIERKSGAVALRNLVDVFDKETSFFFEPVRQVWAKWPAP